MLTRSLFLACLFGCATTSPAGPPEKIVESGGEAGLSSMPARALLAGEHDFVIYAQAEVPGPTPLPSAEGAADTLAKSELLRAVRSSVAGALSSQTEPSIAPAVITVESANATGEVAKNVLPTLAAPTHGWRKVQVGGKVVLRMIARVTIPRAAVWDAISRTLQSQKGGAEFTARAMELLAPPP